jgi:tetratricopeptide (TPR) repeat protein
MPRIRRNVLAERLRPPVLNYVAGPFQLRDDLERLTRVRRAAAPEAVVLYCARILEALAADALRTVSLEPSANVFSNLDTLQQYNLMPTTTRYWAHALRRTGNQVRHVLERIEQQDAELALLFTERWLQWFFHDFRHGLQENLTHDGEPLDLGSRAKLRQLLAALENLDEHFAAVLAQAKPSRRGEFLSAPALPAVLAEMLLDRAKTGEASKVLKAALRKFPDNLRLLQLWGLYWSRTGDYGKALECLEPLYQRYEDDDETAGITAGVYKRCWLKDPTSKESLEKSQRAYRQGWKRSRKTCTYLGINASTTALLLGRAEEARELAGEVRKHLRDRVAVLGKHYKDDPEVGLNYWDQVTLAEADLVLGNLAEARRLYNKAFRLHATEQTANIGVTRMQMEAILTHLGPACSADAFLAKSGTNED